MNAQNKIKLMASTAHGVCEYDFAQDEKTLSFDDFFESLATLKYGDILFCEVTQEEYDKIALNYGIFKY
jgi:hypothetical protein